MNRTLPWVHGALCVAGLFVSGSLTAAHYLQRDLPCGAASAGCETVSRDAWATIFGHPTAVYGLVLYAFLALITFALGNGVVRKVAFVATLGGALASVAFTVRSLAVIQAHCVWCLASAAILIFLFLLHLRGGKSLTDGPKWALAPGLLAVALGAGATYGAWDRTAKADKPAIPYKSVEVNAATMEDWVPEGANILGDPKAPVTLVEFADFRCGTCRAFADRSKRLIAGIPNLRLVYRHFPLTMIPGHGFSDRIAAFAEIAAESGKFWEFLEANNTVEEAEQLRPYQPILSEFGIDADQALERVTDPEDPAVKRVVRDWDFAEKMGFSQTPTMVLLVPGHKPRVLDLRQLGAALQEQPALSFLAPPAP